MKPIKNWKRGQDLPDTKDAAQDKSLGERFLKALGKGLSDPVRYYKEQAAKYANVKPTVSRPPRERKKK